MCVQDSEQVTEGMEDQKVLSLNSGLVQAQVENGGKESSCDLGNSFPATNETLDMEDTSVKAMVSPATTRADLGSIATNSHELYRKNRNLTLPKKGRQSSSSPPQSKAGVVRPIPFSFSPSPPPDLHNPILFPNLPYSVHPNSTPTNSAVGESSPKPGKTDTPLGIHGQETNQTLTPIITQISSTNSICSYGIHSPKNSNANPPRELHQAFQQEGQPSEERVRINESLETLVEGDEEIDPDNQNQDPNMGVSTPKTTVSQTLHNGRVLSSLAGGAPRKPIPPFAANQAPRFGYQTKPRNWVSLLRAQSPSQAMLLEHFPELQQGKNAILEIDEELADDSKWNNCLVGYFLDGKMNVNLLRSTAHKVWDSMGLVSVTPNVSGFVFFEFRDEEAKLSVLEKGPWFFSKRYLVLKNWHRMMNPSKEHPSKIPAWVRIHRLPLELWNQECLSRIASVIGRPIHVDRATAEKSNIAYARICVEIDARNDLPDEVMVKLGGETVMVGIEYQVLPPACSGCRVFGHLDAQCTNKPIQPLESCNAVVQSKASCSQQHTFNPPHPDTSWQAVGQRKVIAASVQPSYAKTVQCTELRDVGISADQPSSMIGTLLSNSFHVLQEAQPSSEHPDTTIPPDKEDPPSEGISDTNLEDVTDYESPSTPVSHPIDFLCDDLLAFGGSRKQQKKAAKADFGGSRKQHKKATKAEWKRSSKHKREF